MINEIHANTSVKRRISLKSDVEYPIKVFFSKFISIFYQCRNALKGEIRRPFQWKRLLISDKKIHGWFFFLTLDAYAMKSGKGFQSKDYPIREDGFFRGRLWNLISEWELSHPKAQRFFWCLGRLMQLDEWGFLTKGIFVFFIWEK